MARKSRTHYPGGIYHVMLRGNNGQQIFFSDSDRLKFYLLLQEQLDRLNCRMHGFCLMTNHLHLAVQVGDSPLSKLMQNIAFRYARWINWRYTRIGHLFQGRYKALLVEEESYLTELIRYIHLNPVRGNLVTNVNEYLWSSHRAYLGVEDIPWVTTNWVLSFFGEKLEDSRNRYYKFILDGVGKESKHNFISGNQKNSYILGSDKFLEKITKNPLCKNKKITLDNIVDSVCHQLRIGKLELITSSRLHTLAKVRAIIAWLSQELNVCTLTEVAKYFNRDVTGLIRSLRKLKLDSDPTKTSNLEKIKQDVLTTLGSGLTI